MLKEDVSLPPFTFYMVKSTYLAYLLVSVLYTHTLDTCRVTVRSYLLFKNTLFLVFGVLFIKLFHFFLLKKNI